MRVTTQEIEDMASRLGLEPPDQFHHGVLSETRSSRQSGRTTRTLLIALVLAEKGETIHIHAHTPQYAHRLMLQAREMAEKAGVPWENIRAPHQPATIICTDHYRWEAM